MAILSKKQHHHHIERTLRIINSKAPFNFVEAYKSLRTNIDFIAGSNEYHSLLVTSSAPGDGKSTVAINLAVAMASSGKHVILVDCDLRKGTIATYLKISRNSDGITSVFNDGKNLSDVVQHIKGLNFDFLPVGPFPQNPAEMIGSKKMISLVKMLSGVYDYVILDTPPVSVVTDAAILSRYVDGVILVARAGVTTKQALSASKRILDDVNANILGAILNDYDARKDSGYGSYGKYGYGGYGKYGYGKYGYGKYGYGGYDRSTKAPDKSSGKKKSKKK